MRVFFDRVDLACFSTIKAREKKPSNVDYKLADSADDKF
jgi:hypothetical protein